MLLNQSDTAADASHSATNAVLGYVKAEQQAIDVFNCTKSQAAELGLVDGQRPLHPHNKSIIIQKLTPILHLQLIYVSEKTYEERGVGVAVGEPSTSSIFSNSYLLREKVGVRVGVPSPHRGAAVQKHGRTQIDLPAEQDCLARIVGDLSVSAGQWLSYGRKSEWYAARKEFGLLPESFTCNRVIRLVDQLRAAGLVDHVTGYKMKGHGYQSLMRPSTTFWDMLLQLGGMTEAGASKAIQPDPDAPLVIVKDEQGNPVMSTNPDAFDVACRKNKALREYMRTFVIEAPIKTGVSEIHQVFNSAALDKGGRYYGWWQNLPSKTRLDIKLNGEAVEELDYRENHPSLLYHGLGLIPPTNCYSVPDMPAYMTDAEARKLIKQTFNRMLNGRDLDGTRNKMAIELSSKELANHIVDTLLQTHRPLVEAKKFGSGIGDELMHKDSEVAVLVMSWAMYAGVPMLPVHDSSIVRRQDGDACFVQMEMSYHGYMNIKPSIRRSIKS